MASTDDIVLNFEGEGIVLDLTGNEAEPQSEEEVEVEPEPCDQIGEEVCEALADEDIDEGDADIDLEATAAADELLLGGDSEEEDADFDPEAVEEHECHDECSCEANNQYEEESDVEEMPVHHDECIRLAKESHKLALAASLQVCSSDADSIVALAEVLMDNYQFGQ